MSSRALLLLPILLSACATDPMRECERNLVPINAAMSSSEEVDVAKPGVPEPNVLEPEDE